MSKVIYKLWVDSTVLKQWDDVDQARMYVHECLDDHESPGIVHFGAFEQTDNGLRNLWGVMGVDKIERKLNELENDTDSRST